MVQLGVGNRPAEVQSQAPDVSGKLDQQAFITEFLFHLFESVEICRANCDEQAFRDISVQLWNFVSAECDGFTEAIASVVVEYSDKPAFAGLKSKIENHDAVQSLVSKHISPIVRDHVRPLANKHLPKEVRARLMGSDTIRNAYGNLLAAADDPESMARRPWGNSVVDNPHYQAFVKFPSDDPELLRSLAEHLSGTLQSQLEKAAEAAKVLDENQSFVLVTHLFPTTWDPFVRELNKRGKHTAWIGPNPVESFGSYGVLPNHEVPTDYIANPRFLGVLACMAAAPNARFLLSGECFYGSNWRINDTTVLYMIMTCVTRTVNAFNRGPDSLNLIMYDGLKPIADEHSGNRAISGFYEAYMNEARRVIYNSNTESFGDFVEYAFGVTAPRLHFFRYSNEPDQPLPRIDHQNGKNIHIACITVCLAEFGEPSRDSVPYYVQKIIESGIHFHYYCKPDDRAVAEFVERLGPHKDHFHAHPINKDQQALVNELHQYHAGFNPSDHVPFAHGIAGLTDRRYQDGMSMFWQSTIGTSFIVYAAAGLPFFLPRGCVGAIDLVPDAALPINLAEMAHMKQYFANMDLDDRLARADKARRAISMEAQMDRFLSFMAEAPGSST